MNKDRLRLALIQYESCNLNRHAVPTKQADGTVIEIDHIGYGFNLETAWDDELLDYLGVEDEDDIQTITQEQADYILGWFTEHAEKDAIKVFPKKWESLTPIRQEVLVNLSYNLGLPTLKQFRKMIKAIRAGDWAEASAQMLDSEAARQTGDRYNKLSKAFEQDSELPLGLSQTFDATPPSEADFTEPTPELLAKIPTLILLDELKRRTGIQ